jgi:hypothetical protein
MDNSQQKKHSGLKRVGIFAVTAATTGYFTWGAPAAISAAAAVAVGKAAVNAYRGDEMRSAAPRPGSK